jgi:RimJ/RimL family protein N-acetyltransferase
MALSLPDPIPTLRLTLRIVERSDLSALLLVNGDDAVTHFLPYSTWTSIADGEAWFERMAGIQASGAALQFVIEDRSNAAVIGTCLLFRHDEGSARAELGYVLGRRHWGCGYMHEALHALVQHAFTAAGLRRLEAEVDPANEPSTRVLERVGFVKEGILRQRWVANRRPYDVAMYGLLRDEYARPAAGARPPGRTR